MKMKMFPTRDPSSSTHRASRARPRRRAGPRARRAVDTRAPPSASPKSASSCDADFGVANAVDARRTRRDTDRPTHTKTRATPYYSLTPYLV
jgi:hypothetical protein